MLRRLAVITLISSLLLPAVPALAGGARDTDRDGLPDRWERANKLNPNSKRDAARDADRDGLSNLQEFRKDTNPRKADSDGDGMPDGWEVRYRLNPKSKANADRDPDRDEYSNVEEYENGTDPRVFDEWDEGAGDDEDGLENEVTEAGSGDDQSNAPGEDCTVDETAVDEDGDPVVVCS